MSNGKEVKINTVGEMIGGDFDGWYFWIKKNDDSNDLDYSIFFSKDSQFQKGIIYDYWAENQIVLESMLMEFGGQINWKGTLTTH